MPFQADTFRLFDLIFFLTNVIDEAGKIFFLNQSLQPLHNGSKQHILGTFDNNGNSAAGLLLQMLGIVIQFEVVFLHHLHNGLPCFF